MLRVMVTVCLVVLMFDLNSQQTVGLFVNDSTSFNGYTLFAPSTRTETYLIDNCGEVVNTWSSNYRPGQVVYLTEEGNLLRTCRINSVFNGGGSGGRIELRSWDDDLLWAYDYSSPDFHHHHDVELLPNGNILVMAWEKRTVAEALQAGRDPDKIPHNGLWSERVIEIKPVGNDEIEVVWEWYLWDHLVQDFDSLANNFDTIANRPERVDINYTDLGTGTDWVHVNSIDYNPALDQIMINPRNFEEFWIIDHSTTTLEAKGSTGGLSGKGGDILYRWGNPRTYDRGSEEDQHFYVQHDAHWIPEGLPDAGKVMIYNNGNDRPGGAKSSIDIVEVPMDDEGNYFIGDTTSFGPDTLYWSYDGGEENHFFSTRISGAQRQPNGNTLICVGIRGLFFEIDSSENVVWEYQNPSGINGPVSQGTQPNTPDVFRAYKYPPEFPGFEGKDLIPDGPLELDPLPSECVIHEDSVSTSVQDLKLSVDFVLAPNPTSSDVALIDNEIANDLSYGVFQMDGRMVSSGILNGSRSISLTSLPAGMYIIRIFDHSDSRFSIHKVIKQ